MSKEREYYRRIINEHLMYKHLAKAYLAVLTANQIYEKLVKGKIETAKQKEVSSWNEEVENMTDEQFYKKYGTEYKRIHPLQEKIEKTEKMKGFRDFQTKKKK